MKKIYFICEDLILILIKRLMFQNTKDLIEDVIKHLDNCEHCNLKDLEKEFPTVNIFIKQYRNKIKNGKN